MDSSDETRDYQQERRIMMVLAFMHIFLSTKDIKSGVDS